MTIVYFDQDFSISIRGFTLKNKSAQLLNIYFRPQIVARRKTIYRENIRSSECVCRDTGWKYIGDRIFKTVLYGYRFSAIRYRTYNLS